MLTETLAKSYTPAESEPIVRQKWDEANPFHADPSDTTEHGKLPYSILIPPPNVTAPLHLGHALNNTLQDILIRYHRMKGYNTLWMPGTDHAGIATQTVVEKRLFQEEGKKRTDFERDDFVSRVQAWKDEYETTITEQLKAIGCSCDWDRQRFTMDEMCAKAVREAFFQLFKDGLIYRGKRLVNWDPVTLTALADDEVEMVEFQGHMWYLRYPLEDAGPDDQRKEGQGTETTKYITVATTRPETMLGDTAVAMNPKDPRAKDLVGKKVRLPIVGRVIPIIEDEYVVLPRDMGGDPKDTKSEFATGFLKVTPAHDPNDWDIGQRHDLEVINVLAPDATISDKHGFNDASADTRQFIGQSREDARKGIVEWFKKNDLLESIRDYTHSVGHSYRSHVPIEPYLSDQWYVKVTDNKLSGEAMRALIDEQFEGERPKRLLTSHDRKGVDDKLPTNRPDRNGAELNDCAFFISFTCYGNWLHGDDRGSVIRSHNLPERPVLTRDEERERQEFESLKHIPMTLDADARSAVQYAIVEVCEHRGWRLIALHVRTNHIHSVVIADTTPERVMNDFKAYSTRRLRERSLVDAEKRVWTRHGSTQYLNDDASVSTAAKYVIEEQGKTLTPAPFDGRGASDQPLPHGRGSLRDGSLVSGDGELKFFPARYSKTFESWHTAGNLRDWCISRQLWWGHRIPVWSAEITEMDLPQKKSYEVNLEKLLKDFTTSIKVDTDDLAVQVDTSCDPPRLSICARSKDAAIIFEAVNAALSLPESENQQKMDSGDFTWIENGFKERGLSTVAENSIALERSYEISYLINGPFTQDPDVLDTWFSSGLWPLSTMGWPEPEAFPETKGLLDTFNPSSVLCTGRDIITLWVGRMVMFNRYFMPDKRLPFNHVYIHTMIQDGHGQRMSKSLGNGVDPRDIVHSHGADALRFSMAQLATTTQDVRLPVDMVCPHCEHSFHPQEVKSPTGYRVASPNPLCPNCNKHMVSGYGVASGSAKSTEDTPLARNTSNRFDLGRNFCNKLWNATRFALSNLTSDESMGEKSDALCDRWILARLAQTVHRIESAIAEYQFNIYADAMYDFIWRDFCDWYLESIKPTVKDNPSQQQVLRTVLNAAMRMLHPIAPFVTETLWPHIVATGKAGLNGVTLEVADLLTSALWPEIDDSLDDENALSEFERIQRLVESIRTLRGEHKVQPRKKIELHATFNVLELINNTGEVVPTLAGLENILAIGEKPDDAVVFSFDGKDQYLLGMVDKLDKDQESARLKKELETLGKRIAGHEGKLANTGYTEKAPAHLVQETRDQLEEFRREMELKEQALSALVD